MTQMTLSSLPPADRHRTIAGDFATLTTQVSDWNAPAPVEGWVARDVVGHLVGWFPGFLAAGGIDLPLGPDLAADPAAAWRHQSAGVQALLDARSTAQRTFAHPRLPAQPLESAISSFYTADVFMHTWDLARAAGIEVHLEPEFCDELLGGLTQMEDVLRSSGQYGPAVPVLAGADVQTRLLGFIGRDPFWAPPSK